MKDDRRWRASVLTLYGAKATEVEELLDYNQNRFEHQGFSQTVQLPLADESHIATWQEYAVAAKDVGVFEALQQRLVQLQFPIAPGISQTEAYRATTRRGVYVADSKQSPGLALQQPEQLQLILHPSLAGTVPVLYTSNRADFVSLVQALTKRNEPQPIPQTMGACMVAGFNNWDRIRRYRQQWETANSYCCSQADWAQEFQRLIPQKHLYQDRFILLSGGDYSHVPARELGLSEQEWQRLSYCLRLEHESMHYLTRRLFNSMQNNLLDELIADYWGIVVATGEYRADWFLRFLGLASFPQYRQGGRLENYRGQPPLSPGAFQVLQHLVKRAAENLADHASQDMDLEHHLWLVLGLTFLTLEDLASPQASCRLQQAVGAVREMGKFFSGKYKELWQWQISYSKSYTTAISNGW